MSNELKENFTTGDIASLIGCNSRTVATMIDEREIVGFKIRTQRRVSRRNLVAYLRRINHRDALEKMGE